MMRSMNKSPNPQGKGLVGVLDSLQQAKNQLQVSAKNLEQIGSELFTSLFILNSEIRFKPTTRQTYWLYFKNKHYRLSLIDPSLWTPEKYGRYIGACELQSDLTWTLELSSDCANDQAFIQEVSYQRLQLEQRMQKAAKIDDVLPVYVATLPYYSRVLASALAYSMQRSMQKGGIAGLSFRQAQSVLVHDPA